MPARKTGDVVHGRYEVQSCLGQGAMGAVYLVTDNTLPGARWALKELDIGIVLAHEREEARELFLRESQLLASLCHPGLPRVVDFFEEQGGSRVLVMEVIHGHPIDQVLSSVNRPLRAEEAVPAGLQVAQVLEYLHAQKPPVVFRDLKPSNLMLTPVGKVCLIDFGIARRYDPEKSKDTQELGTPGFCAPEQYGHGQSSPRSDIYALGTTLFHLLTRKDPQSYNFTFPRISGLVEVPSGLDDCLQKALALKPEDRYADVAAMRKDLEAVLDSLEPRTDTSTTALFPGLLQLARHPRPSAERRRRDGWTFWKEWFRATFAAR